ncbi:MAG TPA: IPT/TIG domain-containing protein, partial [Candidatus Dormibacteraeota bacterium]
MLSSADRPRARYFGRLVAVLAAVLVVATQAATGTGVVVARAAGGGIAYAYDDSGRLLSATVPGGDTAVYNYDAVGNLLSIARHPSSDLSIVHFSPSNGVAGSQVTIAGTGFATSPASNTVTFNGTAATVTSASATQIVVQVPAGAASGPISVSTGGAPASSAAAFGVLASSLAPTISAISPPVAAAGTSIGITGTNFQAPDLATNRVAFNNAQSFAGTGSATSLTATLPPFATSGPVVVGTPYGKVVGPDLVVPPSPYGPADVDGTGRLTLGGSPRAAAVNTAGKVALLLFDGAQGQRVSLNLTWSSGSVTFSVRTP